MDYSILEKCPLFAGIPAKHLREMLEESDNDAYEWLYEEYGNGPLDAYLSDARASVRYSSGGRYAYYTAASFARMWWQAYSLMETVPACEKGGTSLVAKPMPQMPASVLRLRAVMPDANLVWWSDVLRP